LPDDADGVLITRPREAGQETARRVRALGLRPVLAPATEIRLLPARLPAAREIQAVLVTSARAVPALPASYHAIPLLAVGDATARRGTEAGFVTVRSAAGTARELAELVTRTCEAGAKPLLLATGAGQGRALLAALRAAGFAVLRRSVYATRPVAELPAAAHQELSRAGLRAALFFSTDSARAFMALFAARFEPTIVAEIEALAISQSTAAVLAHLPWRRIRVASQPNQDELLALLR
jgi:uroporphyrinogen-III synthase